VLAGHVGVAIGALGIRRTVPLWLLIFASQLPDWTDAVLCIGGIRPGVPGLYSHSFPAVGALAVGAALVAWVVSRDVAGSALAGAVVLSHAAGDFLTGSKPTWPGGPMVGLQLYTRPAIDFVVESMVIVAGWLLYQRSFEPARRYSRPTISLLGALIGIQAAADIALSLTSGLKKC
jgi:hypothetical protein